MGEEWRGIVAFAVLFSLICPFVMVISYLSFHSTDSYKWEEDMDLDSSDYEGSFLESAELRRIRRAMGSMSQFVNQLQGVKNCCVVPQILPRASLQSCAGSESYTNSLPQGVGLFGAIQRTFGGRRFRRALQTFGVQAVCYTDCVFRILKLVSDNATVNFLESNRIFLTELAPVKKFDAWQNVSINALMKCVDPATRGTPAQIVTQSGRICFTRPVILMTCVKRLMAMACPQININQKCNYMMRTIQKFRFG